MQKKPDRKIRTIQFAFDCPHCKGKNLVEVPRKEITMLRKALRQTYERGLAMIKDCKFKVYGLNVDKVNLSKREILAVYGQEAD